MKSIFSYKEKINLRLTEFFENKVKTLAKYPKDITHILETLKEFTLRKSSRIRPLICLAAYALFKEITPEAQRLALTTELLQTSLLIQDDIMDNDDLRRGKPTVHKIYEIYKGYNKNLGMSIAILAGDLAALLAYELVEQSAVPGATKVRVIKEINEILEREYYGQSLDILNAAEQVTREDILQTYNLKTAAYTTTGPLALGAILAGAKEADIAKLKACGKSLGLAFQIIDDLGNLFTAQEETGKKAYADLKEGKKTFIMAMTLEYAVAQQKAIVQKGLGKKELTTEEAESIKSIIVKTKGLEKTKVYAANLLQQTENLLQEIKMREQGKQYLSEIIGLLKEKLSKIH
ncbi:MAG TPA: polyprenyl synthetase family protein [Candidatus Nanoarchaeia archaeon]|nr:polyprenyl synthetase family protein [Candidatus Nanoarchaeia archaeon]